MEQRIERCERYGKAVKEGENFLSFTSAEPCSNFVLREAKTTLSPSRQGHVLPLLPWMGADVWQAYHKVLTLK